MVWAPNVSFVPEGHWSPPGAAARPPIPATALLAGALAAGAAATVVFMLAPDFDIAVSNLFYGGGRHFTGEPSPLVQSARAVFNTGFVLACIATFAGIVFAARSGGPWLGLVFHKWLYLAVCLIIGPLIVANIGLKDHWGRARPRDIIEFGGTKTFTPVFPPADQCVHNCSFISGEASSVFILFFAAAFLMPGHARKMIAAGIVVGSLAGLTRIAQGGHFLSDVLFAGVFMALTAACLDILFTAIRSGVAEGQEVSA